MLKRNLPVLGAMFLCLATAIPTGIVEPTEIQLYSISMYVFMHIICLVSTYGPGQSLPKKLHVRPEKTY